MPVSTAFAKWGGKKSGTEPEDSSDIKERTEDHVGAATQLTAPLTPAPSTVSASGRQPSR